MPEKTMVELLPPSGVNSLKQILRFGDVLGTYGRVRIPQDIWPPWSSIPKAAAYHAIRKVQRNAKYMGKALYPKPEAWRLTHVRMVLGNPREQEKPIWEVTFPHAQWVGLDDLIGKEVIVCRPQAVLNLTNMTEEAQRIVDNESGYDVSELLSFAASALLGEENERFLRFDKLKRYVCSTGVAKLIHTGNDAASKIFPFNMEWYSAHPAMYASFGRLYQTYLIHQATL